MSAMCSVEWRRTRARSPSSFSPLRDEKTSTREYVDGTNIDHARRTKKLLVPVRFFVAAVIEPVSSSYHLNELRGAVHGTSLLFGIVRLFSEIVTIRINRKRRVFFPIYSVSFFLSSFISLEKNSRLSWMLSRKQYKECLCNYDSQFVAN